MMPALQWPEVNSPQRLTGSASPRVRNKTKQRTVFFCRVLLCPSQCSCEPIPEDVMRGRSDDVRRSAAKERWRLKPPIRGAQPRLRAFGHHPFGWHGKVRLRGLGRISAVLPGRLGYVVLLVVWSFIAGCGAAPVGYQPPKGWQGIPLPTTQLSAQ
jgi:hypothetical protein